MQLTDKEILAHTHIAKKNSITGGLELKYAALILFGKEEAIEDFMPRYRFEALFHMCTYEQYNDMRQFPNRYDNRRTMRCNFIKVYDELTKFTECYLPDKFYLPSGFTRREDIRWDLFREIIANLCVHADFSTGYTCFFHVFKNRVVTKKTTRLSPENPEGELTLQQLNNYTKNPLLVRVFHELSWVEDMGSGTRNILRYAPLYYPNYKVEINNGSQFIFSITYMDVTSKVEENGTQNEKMALKKSDELNDDELQISLNDTHENKEVVIKKRKRQQGIISLIKQNKFITAEEIAERLDAGLRTIRRDIEELKDLIEYVGPAKGGYWKLLK